MNSRPIMELQRAHDILIAVVLREIKINLNEEDRRVCAQCAAVLCWALQHDHQDFFTNLLKKIEDDATQNGYTLHNYGN